MYSDCTDGFIRKYFWQVCEAPLKTVDKLELGTYCDESAMKYLVDILARVTYVRLLFLPFNPEVA